MLENSSKYLNGTRFDTPTHHQFKQDIITTNVLTKFHEDGTINVTSRVLTRTNAPPPGGHVFQPTRTIFEHIQDIIRTHVLTKFHEDWTIYVASKSVNKVHADAARWTKSDHKS
ncbi:hypothetical protein DPMN_155644 [Dreissena polymorpha]|uniref:Uncharacterized protein n=1 Tax=Dreissena polymorpha TaxID=45954 RepID=A0A9D4JA48_DREPO|nr:hypothetical protein DPMN_155644 [Dreissena polymorpha]